MIKGYDKFYLEFVMNNIGDAFAYATGAYHLDLDVFMTYLINSGYAAEIEIGNPYVVFGQSGYELVHNVFRKLGIKQEIKPYNITDKDMEAYWCGFVLTYYQYETGYSFSYIHSHISIKDIALLYHPLHEASEDKFVDTLNRILKKEVPTTRLQQRRKALGMSQSQLAREAGVNLRTLQQYEIGAKDINKASAETVNNLASILNCQINDLLEVR